MAGKFSIKTLLDADTIIYIAPVLTVASFFHIFSRESATHGFGQIEIFAALILVGYYLWDKIAVVYPHERIGKKRIEAIVCIVASIFLALVPFPLLMTWQYYNLYNNSDRYSFNKQILAAIITSWLAIGTMYYSSYVLLAERMTAQNGAMNPATESTNTYVAPGMAPATQQGQ